MALLLCAATPARSAEGDGATRAAYLAQAGREGAGKRVEAEALLRKALDGRPGMRVDGPAAGAIRTWVDARSVACTPPFAPVELSCRMRGLVTAGKVTYVAGSDGRPRWAVLRVHSDVDEGNVGLTELALWRATPGGWVLQGAAAPASYDQDGFVDVGDGVAFTGWVGSPGEAMTRRGETVRITARGAGADFRVVREARADTPRPHQWRPHPASDEGGSVGHEPDAVTVWHNGSVMAFAASTGTIRYLHASRAMDGTVRVGDVVFQGYLSPGRVKGTAYTFKRGCPPAAYEVHGSGYAGAGSTLTVVGDPPIRAPGSCEVVGYRHGGPSSVLRFEPMDEGDL